MTAGLAATACPNCGGIYTTDLEGGLRFCPECRHEWDPKAVPAPAPVGRQLGEPLPDEADLIARVDALGPYQTVLYVFHDDGGSDNWRSDRWVYSTPEPQTIEEAESAAWSHFVNEVGSEVGGVQVAERITPPTPLTADEVDDDTAAELEAFTAETDVAAQALLDSWLGSIVHLEGGQTAILRGFPDLDHADVELADGSVVTVDFNTIIRGENVHGVADVAPAEIDDETAELFGDAVLTMACLIVEAGIASLDGTGADATLKEPPSDWLPLDEDAIPLVEQASALAVAMLCKAFDLPREMIATVVATTRSGIGPGTKTEE